MGVNERKGKKKTSAIIAVISIIVLMMLIVVPNNIIETIKSKVGIGVIIEVHIHLNGGTLDESYKYTYHDYENDTREVDVGGGDDLTLPTKEQMTKEGYTFVGWYENSDFSGEVVREFIDLTENKDVYAKWEKAIPESVDTQTIETDTYVAKKMAYWTDYKGESCDSEGNPYIKVDLSFDCSKMNASEYEGKMVNIRDYIPEEYTVMDDSIEVKESLCNVVESVNDKIGRFVEVTWDNDASFLGTPSYYEYSFVMKLDISKVDLSKIKEVGYIYTNGTYIYGQDKYSACIKADFLDSEVYLPSAKLKYSELNDMLNSGSVSIKEGNGDGITLRKTASWTTYNGSPFDAQGNPYVKIEFRVEPSERFAVDESSYLDELKEKDGGMSVNSMAVVPSLYDHIPNEFTVIEESIVNDDPDVYTTVYDDENLFCATFEADIENKIYDFSFVMVLDKSKLSNDYIKGNKLINTNGTTIDSSVDSMGSSYIATWGRKHVELESPSLKYTEIKTETKVTLHPNGGIIAAGKDVTKHVIGKETKLPGKPEITKEGYTFEGWYDNEKFEGVSYDKISKDNVEDKEYWARWSRVSVTKSADWSDYNGDRTDIEGNPYVQTTFNIDLREANIDSVIKKDVETNIAIVLDFSNSLVSECGLVDEDGNILTGMDVQKEETKKFVEKMLAYNDKTKFSIAGFADTMWNIVSLSNDKDYIFEQLDNVCAQRMKAQNINGTNIQNALVWAGRELKDSKAKKKALIMLTDGLPSNSKSNAQTVDGTPLSARDTVVLTGTDVLTVDSAFYKENEVNYAWYNYDMYAGYTLMPESLQKLTMAQADYLKEQVPGIEIATIGVNLLNVKNKGTEAYETLYKVGDNVLRTIATPKLTGEKMYYETEISNITLGTDYLGNIMDECSDEVVEREVVQLKDLIPAEYTFLSDTIEVSDRNIKYVIENDGVLFDFSSVALKNKVYTIAFKTRLKIENAMTIIDSNNGRLYTNGKTIDVTKNSDDSAYFQMGAGPDKRINMSSPILSYDSGYKVTLHTNGGSLLPGKDILSYEYGDLIMLPVATDISKKDSVFVGWYDNDVLQGEPVLAITPTDIGDKEYWAKWDIKIEKTEGEITLTKSASWTTLDGQYTDANGNPYAKIEFTVDLTNANLMKENSSGTSAMTTDIVLVLDFSSSMDDFSGSYDEKGNKLTGLQVEMEAAKEFVRNIMKDRNDTRVAVAGFADTIWPMVRLSDNISSDPEAIVAQMDRVYKERAKKKNIHGTNIGNAVLWAQRQFVDNSTADNKIFTMLSDGCPSNARSGSDTFSGDFVERNPLTGADVIEYGSSYAQAKAYYNANASKYPTYSNNINGGITSYVNHKTMMKALLQPDYMESVVEGVHIIALGLNMDALETKEVPYGNDALSNMATKDSDGNVMFYKTTTGQEASDNVAFIVDMFEDIATKIEKIQNKLTVVDTVPKEYEILGDSVVCEENVIVYIDDATGKLSFDFSNVELENKKYTITFYIKLEVDKIPEDVRAEYETLNTNGSSIDSKDDSMGSSFIEFGDQKVELESPSIDSQLLYKVTLHPEGGTILQSAYVDSYQSGIGCKLPSVNEIYKPGFSFAGWYSNPYFMGTPTLYISSSDIGDKEFWAKWEEESIVEVSKSAKWTDINGEVADENGNPYVEIRFDVDLTKTKPEQHFTAEDVSTDVVVLLDYSNNLWVENTKNEQKDAAKLFIENILYTSGTSRVALGMYGNTIDALVNLEDEKSSNAAELLTAIEAGHEKYEKDRVRNNGQYSNMQSAIIWAQRQLMDSSASRKIIVLFADGTPTVVNTSDIFSGEDVIDNYPGINDLEKTYAVKTDIAVQTYDQMMYAKNAIDGLSIITVNLNINETVEKDANRTRNLLYNMATTNDKDERMYYEALTTSQMAKPIEDMQYNNGRKDKISIASAIIEDDVIVGDIITDKNELVDYIIEDITVDIAPDMGFKLVDLIPYEYELLAETIKKSDRKINVRAANNKVTFTFPYNKVEAKRYIIIFNTALKVDSISDDVLENNETLYTNGNTIDVRSPSLGSAYMECGNTGKILLESPEIDMLKYSDVRLHPNGGTIAIGKELTRYREGIGAILPNELDVTRPGMTFAGWYDNIYLIGRPVTQIGPDARGKKEYWAKWNINGYSVYLHTNGGKLEPGANVTGYVYGMRKALPTSESISLEGYDFMGWYETADFRGTPVTEIGRTERGRKHFYAKWKRIDRAILNDEHLLYLVRGYRELYAMDALNVTVPGRSASVVKAFLTRSDSLDSKRLTSEITYYAEEQRYLNIPSELVNELVNSGAEEQYVYLQIVQDTSVTTTKVKLRYCMSFELN